METPISRYIHLQPSRTPVSLFISSDYFWLMACNLPHRGVFSIRESVTLFLHFYPDNCLPKKITHMFCTPFCHLFHFLFFYPPPAVTCSSHCSLLLAAQGTGKLLLTKLCPWHAGTHIGTHSPQTLQSSAYLICNSYGILSYIFIGTFLDMS